MYRYCFLYIFDGELFTNNVIYQFTEIIYNSYFSSSLYNVSWVQVCTKVISMVAYICTDIIYYIFPMVKKRSEIFRTRPHYIMQVWLLIINGFFYVFLMYMYWFRGFDTSIPTILAIIRAKMRSTNLQYYHIILRIYSWFQTIFHSIISIDGPGIRICGYLHKKLSSASTLAVVLMRMYDT